jgi:periplasmic divalent cation tolerance protein
MTEEIVILCTCSSDVEAEKIARWLLEEHLAACVNVIPGVRSYYWWQRAIESGAEALLLIKSTHCLFRALEDDVRKILSYQVPALLVLPVLAGSKDYLNWLRENLRPR